jgi:hypothetical protein
MNKNEDVQIVVNLTFEDGRSIFNLGFPRNSKKITLVQAAHVLTGAVAMLIKSVDLTKDGLKSHELMKEVVNHLESEFIDTNSFEDAEVKIEHVSKNQMNISQNQINAIKLIEDNENISLFQKQFEIAKVLGKIKNDVTYSDKMTLKEYQKIFK